MLKAAHISSKYPELRKQVNGNVNKTFLYFNMMFICNVSYTSMPDCKAENATNVRFFLNWRKYGSEATQQLHGIWQGRLKKLEIFLLIILPKMHQLTSVSAMVNQRSFVTVYMIVYVIKWSFMWFRSMSSDLKSSSLVCFLCSYEGEQIGEFYEGEGFICFEGGNTYKVSV